MPSGCSRSDATAYNIAALRGAGVGGGLIAGPGSSERRDYGVRRSCRSSWAFGALLMMRRSAAGRSGRGSTPLDQGRPSVPCAASRSCRRPFLVDLDAMVFGMPQALFPAFAIHTLGGGARLTGLLYAAPASGRWSRRSRAARAKHVRRAGQGDPDRGRLLGRGQSRRSGSRRRHGSPSSASGCAGGRRDSG